MSADRPENLTVTNSDSASHGQPFGAEIKKLSSPKSEPESSDFISSLKESAHPALIDAVTGLGLNRGLDLVEGKFGPGAKILDKRIGCVSFAAHENHLTAAKFFALPVAAAATYSFKSDLHSLTHSKTLRDTLWDSAALLADSVTMIGAASTFIPKAKFVSTPLEFAGLTARVFIGELNDEPKIFK